MQKKFQRTNRAANSLHALPKIDQHPIGGVDLLRKTWPAARFKKGCRTQKNARSAKQY